MANTKFKTENGLLITGGDAEFANQVFIGNTSSRANLTVDGSLILINGDLVIDGDVISLAPTAYTGDLLAGVEGLNIGNSAVRFANGFFNNVFIYERLHPVGNTIPLGNSTNRWVISANSLTISTTLSATGAVTFSNTLSATGAVTFSNTLSATGAVTISNTLSATGAVTFSNTLSATGAVTFSNNLTVSGFVNTATRFDVDGGSGGTTNGSALTATIVGIGNSTSNVTFGPAAGIVIGSSVSGAGVKPLSNTVGNELGDADQRWILNANTGNFSGLLTATSGATFTGTVNASAAFNAGTIGTTNGVSVNTSAVAIGNSSVNTVITGQGFQPTSNVNFDSGTFFVDFVNNRVGIGNTAPGVELRVTGAVDISSTANIQGNANVGGTLGVAGATTLTGAATLSSTLGVTGAITSSGGANPSSNTVGTALGTTTQRWVLNANTGNFSGAVTFSNNIAVSGNLMVTSACTHYIEGNVVFDSSTLFIDSVSGRVGVGTITPDTRFKVDGSANITGATVFSNTVSVTGAVSLGNTLSVTNTATFANTVVINGSLATINALSVTNQTNTATLYVTTSANVGTSGFINSIGITHTGFANVGGTLRVSGAANALSTLGVNGLLFAAGNANIAGQTNTATLYVTTSANVGSFAFINSVGVTHTGYANITGAVTFANTLSVTGAVTFANTLSVTNTTTFSNNVTINGTLNANTGDFSGSITVNTAQSVTIGSISATTNGFSAANNLIRMGNTSVNVSISPSQVRTNRDDTVSAPGYSWIGDLNTGLYRPAADTIGITTNGVERMRVNNSLISANLDLYVNTNTAIKIPTGNTLQQPAASAGLIRFNTETGQYEGSNSSAWSTFGGLGVGQKWYNYNTTTSAGGTGNDLRQENTFYQNQTGKPIALSIRLSLQSSAGTGQGKIYWKELVGDTPLEIAHSHNNEFSGAWATSDVTVYAIIPPNHYYLANTDAEAEISNTHWRELR